MKCVDGLEMPAPIVFSHEALGCVSLWTHHGLNWSLANRRLPVALASFI